MSIFYVDPIGGSDSNSGLDFVNRKASLRSAAASTSPGDEIRIIKTPGGVLSTDSTWTSMRNIRPSTISNGTSLNSGGAQGGIQVTHYSHGFDTGDLIYLYAFNEARYNGFWRVTVIDANTYTIPCYYHLTNVYTNSYRFCWRAQNQLVTFEAPKVKNVSNNINGVEGNWVTPNWGSPSIGNVNVNNYRYSQVSSNDAVTQSFITQVQVYSGFTTGRCAKHTFTSTLDLTGYRQLSFFWWQQNGNISGEQFKFCLCSDADGLVPVYEFPIPASNRTYHWNQITVDCSNLPAGQTMTTAVASIALYVHTDRSSGLYRFQNVIACKGPEEPDCLSHTSVISPKRPDDLWWNVIFADEELGAVIGAKNYEASMTTGGSTSPRDGNMGYLSPSFAVNRDDGDDNVTLKETGLTCHVYNPSHTYAAAKGYSAFPSSDTDNTGEYISYKTEITVKGGYNRTDMSTRDDPDDLSWFFSGGTGGSALYLYGVKYSHFENLGMLAGQYGIYLRNQAYANTLDNIHCAGSGTGIYLYATCNNTKLTNIKGQCIYRTLKAGSTVVGVYVDGFRDYGGDGAIECNGGGSFHIRNVISKNHRGECIKFYQSTKHVVKDVYSYMDEYTFKLQNNPAYVTTQNVNSFGNKGFQYAQPSASSAMAFYDFRHVNVGWTPADNESENYIFYPSQSGGGSSQISTASWNQVYNTHAAGGFHNPHQSIQHTDGTWVALNGTVQIERGDGYNSFQSMGIAMRGGGYREDFGATGAISVSDQANGIFSRGMGARVKLAEFTVVANQQVDIAVHAKKTSSNNRDVDGNLYVGPHCGNAITRSALISSYDTWEELTVQLTPSYSGIMILEMEVFQYFGQQSSQPPRKIHVDNIVVTQVN